MKAYFVCGTAIELTEIFFPAILTDDRICFLFKPAGYCLNELVKIDINFGLKHSSAHGELVGFCQIQNKNTHQKECRARHQIGYRQAYLPSAD